jgi:hypothetical protein
VGCGGHNGGPGDGSRGCQSPGVFRHWPAGTPLGGGSALTKSRAAFRRGCLLRWKRGSCGWRVWYRRWLRNWHLRGVRWLW